MKKGGSTRRHKLLSMGGIHKAIKRDDVRRNTLDRIPPGRSTRR